LHDWDEVRNTIWPPQKKFYLLQIRIEPKTKLFFAITIFRSLMINIKNEVSFIVNDDREVRFHSYRMIFLSIFFSWRLKNCLQAQLNFFFWDKKIYLQNQANSSIFQPFKQNIRPHQSVDFDNFRHQTQQNSHLMRTWVFFLEKDSKIWFPFQQLKNSIS